MVLDHRTENWCKYLWDTLTPGRINTQLKFSTSPAYLDKKAVLSQRWPGDARYISIGSPVAQIWPFAYLGGIWSHTFWGRGGRRGSAMAPFKRAMVVSYRLSTVTVVLSVTIQLQFAIECLRSSNQQGGGSLWAQISGCSPWSRPMMFGSAESEHPRLTIREIISEEFQPMWPQSTNVTDGQTTCDCKTAICTKVHRAVKMQLNLWFGVR